MSKLINETQGGFTVVTNNIVRDNSLSLKAKGLMLMLLSLPDGWDFSINGLAAISKDGKAAIRAAVNELESSEYLTRKRERNEHGQLIGSDWVISNVPMSEKPTSENQTLGFRTQINKEETNKDESSNPIVPLATSDEVREVVDHLNSVTGSSFRANSSQTKRRINARLKEGYTVEDLKAVIDVKSSKWLKDPKMKTYLRPETLFGAKCEGYVQEAKGRKVDDAQYQSFDSVW